MTSLEGKVAFITGAGRGQGRSHAQTLATAGAAVIAVDICRDIDSIAYPLASEDDLQETVRLVEARGGRILGLRADVRSSEEMERAVATGAAEFGTIDVVVANAGVAGHGNHYPDRGQLFRDIVEVNLTGVWNTVHATAPAMIDAGRGSIIIISSTQGLRGGGGDGGAGTDAYFASKHGVVGLMRSFAHWLAPHSIRVNTVHPTGVATPMVTNETVQAYLRSVRDSDASTMGNLLPVTSVEEVDISHAVAWLASDEARYVTGITMPVDAGAQAR